MHITQNLRLLVWAFLACCWASGATAAIKVGEPAPPLTLHTVDGRTITSGDLRGKVVLLNFWATWCLPCRTEIPAFHFFQRVYGKDGFEVFAVSTEDSKTRAELRQFVPDGSITLVRRLRGPYGVKTGVPTTYVIDRKGVLRYAKAGALDLRELGSLLIPLIGEPSTPR